MQTVIARPQNEAQQAAITAVLEALEIPYALEAREEADAPYNPEFVQRILSEKKKGEYKVIRPEDLWK